MNCPRCDAGVLTETRREGILIDYCRSCRGIWLDRGELEKLITLSSQENDEIFASSERPPRGSQYPEDHLPRRSVRDERDDDDHKYRPKRKKSWVESLGDIFD